MFFEPECYFMGTESYGVHVNTFSHFTSSYMILLIYNIINDTYLCEETDHINFAQ